MERFVRRQRVNKKGRQNSKKNGMEARGERAKTSL
jgi:hypothetical protein